ncbi:MAG: hypothetical protein IRZ01_05980 [Thermoflavifilum aggregans]|nr:hypothetical protein [Thermoflavifilum aggregans]
MLAMQKTLGFVLLISYLPVALSAQSVQLQYVFQQGNVFELRVQDRSETYLTIQDEHQRTSTQGNYTLKLKVVKTMPATSSAVIEARYEKIFLTASSQDVTNTINTEGNDQDALNLVFRRITERPFYFTIQSNGTIQDMEGIDSLIHYAIGAIPPKTSKSDRQAIINFVREQFDAAAFRNQFISLFPRYADHAVQVGDGWTDIVQLSGRLGGSLTTAWKFDYGDKFGLKISAQGNMISNQSAVIDLGGDIMGNVDVRGNTQSSYLISAENGWPTRSVQHTEINGEYVYRAAYNKKIKQDIHIPVKYVHDLQYELIH